MRTRKLIKAFNFTSDRRRLMTFHTKVRLSEESHCLELKKQLNGAYPTDNDLWAATWITYPKSLRRWNLFQVEAVHATVDGVVKTSLGFRLGDGTNQKWWNGTAWVTDTSHWNTEAEVSTRIASFPVTTQKLQVIVNLKTTDSRYTPKVYRVKVLWESIIEFQEDLVFRSLMPLFRNNLRPIADYPIVLQATGTTIDLGTTYKLETPYNVVGIDSVFNHTDDPNHWTDLYQSWNPTTKVITLNTSVAAGKSVWVRFTWEPEVAVTTSQSYTEIKKVPCIILQDFVLNGTERGQQDEVIDPTTGVGTVLPPPVQGNFDFTAILVTDKATDQARLADEVKRFFLDNPLLNSTGLDEEFRLWMVGEYESSNVPNAADLNTGRIRFTISGAVFYLRTSKTGYAVKTLKTTDDSNLELGR